MTKIFLSCTISVGLALLADYYVHYTVNHHHALLVFYITLSCRSVKFVQSNTVIYVQRSQLPARI